MIKRLSRGVVLRQVSTTAFSHSVERMNERRKTQAERIRLSVVVYCQSQSPAVYGSKVDTKRASSTHSTPLARDETPWTSSKRPMARNSRFVAITEALESVISRNVTIVLTARNSWMFSVQASGNAPRRLYVAFPGGIFGTWYAGTLIKHPH